MSYENEDKNVAICNERLAALVKLTSANDVFLVAGTTYTQPEVLKAYQASLDTRKTVTAARAAEASAVAHRKLADAERRKVDKALRAWAVNKFGANAPETTELGFAPKPKAQPSAKAKAEAADKAQATRKARGIMGKKQRSEIHAPAQPPVPVPVPVPGK